MTSDERLKAYAVKEPTEGHTIVVFAETRSKALVKAHGDESMMCADYIELRATREPQFDQYAECGKVPIEALLEDGWWFWCHKCHREHVDKDEGAKVINGEVYCAECAAALEGGDGDA